ncbi:MAG TPA: hypothetical protein VGH53_32565 [Streptosporangiaceae bacterium]|jgi:myo-inositol-1-phosphate synthase
MGEAVKVAVIGTGNNISALVQGIALYRATGSLTGVRTPVLDGLGAGDIEFVAALAISPEKIGRDLTEAIFLPPSNFLRLAAGLPLSGVTVRRGLTDATEAERVAPELAGAEVVLYAQRPAGDGAGLCRGGPGGGGGVHQHHLRRSGPRPALAGSVRHGRSAAAG